jgi:hypothetical protein
MAELRRLASRAAALLLALGLLGALAAAALGVDRRLGALEERRNEAARQAVASEERLGGAAAPLLPAGLVYEDLTPTLAAAEIQGRLGRAARRHGGEVLATAALDPEEAGGALRVPVRLDAEFEIGGLAAFLHELETTPPVLHVDALEVRRGRGTPEAGAPVRLSVAATLSAFVDPPGGGL